MATGNVSRKGLVFEKTVTMNVIKYEPEAHILCSEDIGIFMVYDWYLPSLLCKCQLVLTLIITHALLQKHNIISQSTITQK